MRETLLGFENQREVLLQLHHNDWRHNQQVYPNRIMVHRIIYSSLHRVCYR